MHWPDEVRRRFARAGRHLADPVVAELAEHAADLAAATRAAGATEDEATRQACEAIDRWSTAPGRFEHRGRPRSFAGDGDAFAAGFLSDVRASVRVAAGRPGPAVLSASTLALGVAAVAVMATLVWCILLAPLPWPDSDRLVQVTETRQGGASRFGPLMTNATYLAWRERATTIEGLGAWSRDEVTVAADEAGGTAERIRGVAITASLQPLVGARPARGRLLREADERPNAPPVVLISNDLWVRHFGGRGDIIGRSARFDGQSRTIVGVMAPSFRFPDRGAAFWRPKRVPPVVVPGQDGHELSLFQAMARLKPGVTPDQAAAEATARARTAPDPGPVLVAVFGGSGPAVLSAAPALDVVTRDVRPALLVLLAAVLLLLLCAVANVANLQVATAAARRREMAIRTALGASSRRLLRQLLAEHVVVGAVGGLVGLALARAALTVVPHVVPSTVPRLDELVLAWPVALAALGIALLAGIATGILPAVEARRLDLAGAIAEDGLAPSGAGFRLRGTRLRAAIMVTQVAAAAVLLVGGWLLVRSFLTIVGQDRGLDTHGVLTASVPLPEASFPPVRRAALLETLVARMRQAPGVTAAAFTNVLPLTGSESIRAFEMRARRGSPSPTVMVQAAFRLVSPGYFAALGLRTLEGRPLSDADTATSRRVVVVNRAFARTYLDPPFVGRTVPAGRNDDPWDVVGVVDDVGSLGGEPPLPEMLVSYAQWTDGVTTSEPELAIRTMGRAEELAPLLRGMLRDLDPELALGRIRTMEALLDDIVAVPRLYSVVVSSFAALALLIAAVGLFGLLSCVVSQRGRELAVRAALGAAPSRLVGLVLRQGLLLVVAGLVVGFAVAALLARGLAALLAGVGPTDPIAFAVVAAILLAVGAVACAVPALRAARVNPIALLKRG